MLKDEGSTSHSCGQHAKVCSIHIQRPVLVTMQVQTSSLGILIENRYHQLIS